jgi:ATP-dependent Clp protease adaptor protein ClpS
MDTLESASQALLPVAPAAHSQTRPERSPPKAKREPNYHVVIWNDDEHTFEYVIEMLVKICRHSFAKAYDVTWQIDHLGKAIAYTCHRELAELKRDQIIHYGADSYLPDAKPTSMRATIEPAPD